MLWESTGNVSDGVIGEFYTLEETKRKFADLDEGAIINALEYFHLQAFGRPLGRNETGGDK